MTQKITTGLGLEEKKFLIDFDSSELTVKHPCKLLNLSRTTAYYEIKVYQPTQEEVDIKNAIDRIHFDEPAYGFRRVRGELEDLGFTNIGIKRTRRYMRETGIIAFYPKAEFEQTGFRGTNVSLPASGCSYYRSKSGLGDWHHV